jgi:hypothetical protein
MTGIKGGNTVNFSNSALPQPRFINSRQVLPDANLARLLHEGVAAGPSSFDLKRVGQERLSPKLQDFLARYPHVIGVPKWVRQEMAQLGMSLGEYRPPP